MITFASKAHLARAKAEAWPPARTLGIACSTYCRSGSACAGQALAQHAAAGGPSPDGGLEHLAKAQPKAERLLRQDRAGDRRSASGANKEEVDDISGPAAYALGRTSGLRIGC